MTYLLERNLILNSMAYVITFNDVISVNEKLYKYSCANRTSKAALLRVVLSFFSASEISTAKKCLINEFHVIFSDNAFMT